MPITIIIGIVVLSVLAIAHELGHFVSGKAFGVKVEEFGLGLPPRIFGIKRGETIYSLNAIPFGAFNKFAGEEDPEVPRSFASKGKGARLLTLSAGSLVNAIVALILFSTAFMVPHDMIIEPLIVKEVAPSSPAAIAGIESGDTLLSINGKPLNNLTDLLRVIQLNLGEEITIEVKHSDSAIEDVQVVPRWRPPEGEGAVGVEIDLQAAQALGTTVRVSYPFWRAIPLGAIDLAETFVLYKDGIISMIVGTASAEVAGPVGIVQMVGEAAKFGVNPLLQFTAIISLVLAIFNLFPLPALDGGRIMFVLIEWARRGKRVAPKTEGMVHFIGLLILIAVLLAVTYRDIIRIITGESLIP